MNPNDDRSKIKTYIRLLVASIAFFAPLTAVRVYESAFALPYLGVNSVSLYANIFIVGVIAFVHSFLPRANLT